MAGSRIEKLGTVFSRVRGLLCSGAMKEADKPIWYDVYEAFPPRVEPKFDRYLPEKEPVNILYREDSIRAKFYNTFGSPDIIDMRHQGSQCYSERFISRYCEISKQSGDRNDSELFEATKESLKLEGINLKTLAEIAKEKKILQQAKAAQSKESIAQSKESSQPGEITNSATLRLEKLNENKEGADFIYDDVLDPELKRK